MLWNQAWASIGQAYTSGDFFIFVKKKKYIQSLFSLKQNIRMITKQIQQAISPFLVREAEQFTKLLQPLLYPLHTPSRLTCSIAPFCLTSNTIDTIVCEPRGVSFRRLSSHYDKSNKFSKHASDITTVVPLVTDAINEQTITSWHVSQINDTTTNMSKTPLRWQNITCDISLCHGINTSNLLKW